MRQGLRRPKDQISGNAPAVARNGLSEGMAKGWPPSTSMRRILPRSAAQVLAVALGVAARAAVAQRDVEAPVVPEGQPAAVVVGEGLAHEEQLALAARVGLLGVRGDAELRDVRVAGAVGVVHEEPPVLGVARVEGQAQKPPLAARADARGDVQEDGALERAVADDADAAALLGHEHARAVAGRGLQVERVAQAAGHQLGGERGLAGDRRSGRTGRGGRGRRRGRAFGGRAPAAAEREREQRRRPRQRGRRPHHAQVRPVALARIQSGPTSRWVKLRKKAGERFS